MNNLFKNLIGVIGLILPFLSLIQKHLFAGCLEIVEGMDAQEWYL